MPVTERIWTPTARGSLAPGEIVLPLISGPDQVPPVPPEVDKWKIDLPGDAFASRAMSWPVAVHEGFPGHALQIARLLEPDTPLARGPLAFNHAATEGWAVYAESEIFPELPLEARVLTLHSQLRRAAGAFLDPGLQQGRFTREQARRLLRHQVGLTTGEADQTLWRITSWSPGQATSYFCGQVQLAALRTAVECRLGLAFDRREYHDFLLAQGLLPLSLLRRWVLERVAPERLARAAEAGSNATFCQKCAPQAKCNARSWESYAPEAGGNERLSGSYAQCHSLYYAV